MTIKKCFLTIILFSISFALSAQTQNKSLDSAIKSKDIKTIKNILEWANKSEKNKLEATVLNAAKQAVRANELDFAQKLAEAVLLSNTDNKEAQELYSSIGEMKQRQKEIAEKQAQKKAAADAEAKAKAEQQAKVDDEAKRKADSEALYKAVYEVSLKNFALDVSLGLSFGFFGSGFANKAFNQKKSYANTGISFGTGAAFSHPFILLKTDMKFSWMPVTMSGQDLFWLLGTRFALGTDAAGGVPIMLSFGFMWSRYYAKSKGLEAETMLYTKVGTPSIGIGIEGWKPIPKLGLTFRFDWLPLSVSTYLMDFGMYSNIGIRYEFWKNKVASLQICSDFDLYILAARGYADWNIIPGIYINATFRGYK